jgi:hydroxymethylbilane synthase
MNNESSNYHKKLRIGTRDSQLAMWQAHKVAELLQNLGYDIEIISVKSTGDLILDKPLYELGITGVFTKTLDVAMLNGQIDIAVHSLKDVPTILPKGMIQGAVLERANNLDLLAINNTSAFLEDQTGDAVIATGSLRRKAQWLHKYPNHTVVDLRGNVISRMQKLQDNQWHGAIFAAAGLERINIRPSNAVELNWMIPAPAQGIVMCAVMDNDDFSKQALHKINHKESEICAHVERQFLRKLEGGCTAPIGALASIIENKLKFKGGLFSLDGKQKIVIEKEVNVEEFSEIGGLFADEILAMGGNQLMKEIKAIMHSKTNNEQ